MMGVQFYYNFDFPLYPHSFWWTPETRQMVLSAMSTVADHKDLIFIIVLVKEMHREERCVRNASLKLLGSSQVKLREETLWINIVLSFLNPIKNKFLISFSKVFTFVLDLKN